MRKGIILNDAYVESLDGGRRRVTIPDRGCANLFLVVYPTRRKTWLWRGRIDGKPEKTNLGIFPNCTTKMARAKAAEIADARDRGDNLIARRRKASEIARRSQAMTCDRTFELYVEHHCRPRNKAWRETERIYKREISPLIGNMPIYDVGYQHVMPIIRAKALTAPIQSNRIRGVIRHWFKWSTAEGWDMIHLDTNPIRNIPKLAEEKSRQRCLDDYELSLLMKVLNESTSLYAEPVRFIIHTGCRRAEAFEMRWDELKELDAEGDWTLPRERSKNGRALTLPLPPVMVDMLKDRRLVRGDNVLVWQTTGRSGKGMSGFSKAVRGFRAAMQEMALEDERDIEHWVLHDLRRTFITLSRRLRDQYWRRLPDEVIFGITNHTLEGVRGIYNRYDYYEEKKEALELWADFLARLEVRNYRQLTLF